MHLVHHGVTISDGNMIIYATCVLVVFIACMILFIICGVWDFWMDFSIAVIIAIFCPITVPVLLISAISEVYENWKHKRGKFQP